MAPNNTSKNQVNTPSPTIDKFPYQFRKYEVRDYKKYTCKSCHSVYYSHPYGYENIMYSRIGNFIFRTPYSLHEDISIQNEVQRLMEEKIFEKAFISNKCNYCHGPVECTNHKDSLIPVEIFDMEPNQQNLHIPKKTDKFKEPESNTLLLTKLIFKKIGITIANTAKQIRD